MEGQGIPEDMPVCFGQKARIRRKRLGLSQQEIERRTGIDQAHYSRIERGKIKMPGVHYAVLIARALECDVEDILAEAGPRRPAAA